MKHANKISMVVLIMMLALVLQPFGVAKVSVASAAGNTYYVDSAAGSDANPGTSEQQPWQSLTKVNGTTFAPGDRILFKSGSSWTGSLVPKSSGAAGNHIVFDKYGEGALPSLNGGGRDQTVYLRNIEYVTIQNLEITNSTYQGNTTLKRNGIMIEAHDKGTMHGIHLRNLDIHDIEGLSERPKMYENAAIYVKATKPAGKNNLTAQQDPALGSFDDLLIENNHIHDIGTIGFYSNGTNAHWNDTTFESWYTNVVFRNNVFNNTGSDSIVLGYCLAPVVEYNTAYDAGGNGDKYQYIAGIWSWATKDALYQNNEVARVQYQVQSTSDSAAFDTDIHTYGNHIYQYNYTHDNAGGFMMSMGELQGGKNILRYNISQNDMHYHWKDVTISVNDPSHYYNNVFYNDTEQGFKIANASDDVVFNNNLFYLTGTEHPFPTSVEYDFNAYYGIEGPASDLNKVVGDPLLENPGTGGDGRNTVGGYKLKAGSPLIGAGKFIDNNGGKDYWGNPLYNGDPDIGAHEYGGQVPAGDAEPPTQPHGVIAYDVTDTDVSLAWKGGTDNRTVAGYVIYRDGAEVGRTGSRQLNFQVGRLEADTNYEFTVRTLDAAGNQSADSDLVQVTTAAPGIIIDDQGPGAEIHPYNAAGPLEQYWGSSTYASGYYGTGYVVTRAGDGSRWMKWKPQIEEAGLYGVYYWLPYGDVDRASNSEFTVYYDGGSEKHTVNQVGPGGAFKLLGVYPFAQGENGYVQLTNKANNTVNADAVKFLKLDAADNRLKSLSVTAPKQLLDKEEETQLSVSGTMLFGEAADLSEAEISFVSGDPAVAAVSDGGKVTALKAGHASIRVQATLDGFTLERELAFTVKGLGVVELSAERLTIHTGTTEQLAVKGYLTTGEAMDLATAAIQYASSNPDVASVDGAGLVTAHRSGAVIISAIVSHGGDESYGELELTVLDDFEISAPVLKDGEGNAVSELKPDDMLYASVDITNRMNAESSAVVVLAIYSGERVVSLSYAENGVAADASETLTAGLYVKGPVAGLTCKVFVWDSMENMKPLAEFSGLPIGQ